MWLIWLYVCVWPVSFFGIYNTLRTLWRASWGLVVTLQQMPEPPLHQSSPHSSEDEARLLCGVQVESDLKRKKRRILFYVGRDGMDGFFWWIKLTRSFWEGELLLITGCGMWVYDSACVCVCVCVCQGQRKCDPEWEAHCKKKRMTWQEFPFPKGGHYIPT